MHPIVRLAPLLLAAAGLGALAQDAPKDLPKDLHGHWAPTAKTGRAAGEPFDLENITRKDDGTFQARLSWTAADPRCTIRYQPITGRVTASGLHFEPKTPCKETWTAELARNGAVWVGMASNTASPPVVLELTAK
jgi:hypothetical protein